jgi:ribosomal protein S18 acetylase RimI-like enzyme
MLLRTPESPEDFQRYFELRRQVLRAPWGGQPGSERDALEESADHALIENERGRVIAVGRVHLNAPHEAQVRYVAVAAEARGRGHGRRLMAYLEQLARQRGASRVVLNAREDVVPFYRKLGYEVIGPGPTLFETIKHSRMQKRLD